MIPKLLDIVREAGHRVLTLYHEGRRDSRLKSDQTPVTDADMVSHHYLRETLVNEFGWPVISEEAEVSYDERRHWERFWLVDPLDGTREFMAGTGEFTINVALIQNGIPVVGVVYAPVLDEMYYASRGEGAFLVGAGRLPLPSHTPRPAISLASRFHHSLESDTVARANGVDRVQVVGAALKFGRLARGDAQMYPRWTGSKEWDVAAGQLLVTEAGGAMVDCATRAEIQYNKPEMRNGPFVAVGDASMLNELNLSTEVVI